MEKEQKYKEEQLPGNGKVFTSAAHTFGTDAILLAHFSSPGKRDRACDLGTGCGIIPLLWCSRGLCSRADGVELAQTAAEQAQAAVEANHLQEKLHIYAADLKDAPSFLSCGSYDLVTMNPPYQRLGAGKISATESGRMARHESTCTLADAARTAQKLLRFGGRFCICLRPERLCDALEAMRAAQCEPKRICFVHKSPGKEPWLFLAEGKRGARPGLRIDPPLFLYEQGSLRYSEAYHTIYESYREETL